MFKKIIHSIKLFFEISIWKTIRINFRYLPPPQAFRLPILINRHTQIRNLKGKLIIESPIKTGMIKFGMDSLGIYDNKRSRSIWEVRGNIVFKGWAYFGNGSKISVMDSGKLILGDNLHISGETAIVCKNHIEFDRNVLISWDTLVMDTDFHKIIYNGEEQSPDGEIFVGENVWIGCRCLILKNTIIPDGCIIGAFSRVSYKFSEKESLIIGNPAKIIKSEINWRR